MKKRILILLLAMVLVFSLAACGASKYAGEYTCTKVSMELEGEEISASPAELFDGDVTLEIVDDTKATLTLGGDPVDAEYTVNGSEITLTIEGTESKGTISENTIELDLMGTGMKYIFEKNGTSEEKDSSKAEEGDKAEESSEA